MRAKWQKLFPDRLDGTAKALLTALVLLTIGLFQPNAVLPGRVTDWLLVLDITQSMNVRDYNLEGKQVSRLEYAKHAMRDGLRDLPCGSRVALGLFTERNILVITRPLEVCRYFSALDEIVARMDWRMAWAADSFITHGLYDAIEQSTKLGADIRLMFITDGHQAPPADPRYMPGFPSKPGVVKGVILGSGKPTLSPIPKLDDRNEIAGFWTQDETQRYGNFGMAETLSVLAMEQGQHDRNAGHGPGNALLSTAHLSRLDETNLQRLSATTGLRYARMQDERDLIALLGNSAFHSWRDTPTDLRPVIGLPAMLLVLFSFLPQALLAHARRFISTWRKR